MSKTTKRKHVLKEILWDDYELPKDNQTVVKVLSSKGNNLHEVESSNGDVYLVSMPNKFRKNIWVKRGDYILVEPIAEGDKVKAEIVKIMNKDSIRYFKENNVWPKTFEQKAKPEDMAGDHGMFVNTNRQNVNIESDLSEDNSTDSNDDSSDES